MQTLSFWGMEREEDGDNLRKIKKMVNNLSNRSSLNFDQRENDSPVKHTQEERRNRGKQG